jgi:hypothetical protein
MLDSSFTRRSFGRANLPGNRMLARLEKELLACLHSWNKPRENQNHSKRRIIFILAGTREERVAGSANRRTLSEMSAGYGTQS